MDKRTILTFAKLLFYSAYNLNCRECFAIFHSLRSLVPPPFNFGSVFFSVCVWVCSWLFTFRAIREVLETQQSGRHTDTHTEEKRNFPLQWLYEIMWRHKDYNNCDDIFTHTHAMKSIRYLLFWFRRFIFFVVLLYSPLVAFVGLSSRYLAIIFIFVYNTHFWAHSWHPEELKVER